jgi:hypothetical protein
MGVVRPIILRAGSILVLWMRLYNTTLCPDLHHPSILIKILIDRVKC